MQIGCTAHAVGRFNNEPFKGDAFEAPAFLARKVAKMADEGWGYFPTLMYLADSRGAARAARGPQGDAVCAADPLGPRQRLGRGVDQDPRQGPGGRTVKEGRWSKQASPRPPYVITPALYIVDGPRPDNSTCQVNASVGYGEPLGESIVTDGIRRGVTVTVVYGNPDRRNEIRC
jgi:hypothetical protein